MPINKKEVSKYLYFKIPKEVSDQEDEIKEEIGDYLRAAILDNVGEGVSPVTGGAFKKLNSKYAKDEKKGDTTPNLDLNGDMLDSLEYEPTDRGLKIGIFDEDQAIKAFNHNVGDTLPKRQFIPGPDQNFKKDIMKEINAIIKEFVDASKNNEEV